MNNFSNKEKIVLIGKHEKVISALCDKGIKCIELKDNADIDFSVGDHADMAAYALTGKRIILDKRQTEAGEKLKSLGFDVLVTEENIAGAYPKDIILNAARIGNTVICSEKYISREILKDAENVISVKQGYSKCSICIVNDNAFITDDKGIYERCKSVFDVLLVDKGDIILKDKEYGFIGGASGRINGKLYFFGSLNMHRDGERIKAFLEKHNAEYECLFDERLTDIGGVVEL